MGWASTMYPSAAGTTMKAVERIPRASSPRKAARSAVAHCADSDGRSAVMMDTVKMAWGSWKNVYADMYAVNPVRPAASTMTCRRPSWFTST